MTSLFSAPLRRLSSRWERLAQTLNNDRADLQRRLTELELRLGEYDHRVKNNTQMILSILVTAEHAAANSEVRSALESVTRKLQAMIEVQAILQRAGDQRSLRCDDLLRELVKGIQAASPRHFMLIVESEPLELPSTVAVPLGLIVNELVTNSIKHGIDPSHGRIRVSLKAIGEELELRVEDNGPGIDPDDVSRRISGLGMVQHLAKQLHGRFQTRSGPGGHSVLRFHRPPLQH